MLDDALTWEGIRGLAVTHVLRDFPTGGLMFCEPGSGKAWKLPNGRGLRQMGAPQRTFDTRGQIVSTRDAWWAPWRAKLTALPGPFVLVSTFHDALIGDAAVSEMFAEGSAVSAWFGVQVATADPRVTRMPIGIKGEMVGYLRQGVRRDAADRDCGLYLNFSPRTEERRAVWEALSWATREVPKPDTTPRYVEMLGRSRFVLSPPGRSWDCYRTYEAIAMGAVPIVKRAGPISEAAEGLPVLWVDDWAEVTPARLERAWHGRTTGSVERMTLSYWKARIERAKAWQSQ
jgi:hypothetical protein